MKWESPSSFSHSQGPSLQQFPESLGRLGRKKPPQAYGESPLEIRLAFLRGWNFLIGVVMRCDYRKKTQTEISKGVTEKGWEEELQDTYMYNQQGPQP